MDIVLLCTVLGVGVAVGMYITSQIENRIIKKISESHFKLKKGDQGIHGEKGTIGDTGLPGRNGEDGKDGEHGLHGADGEGGTDGVNGIDGTNGKEGLDGATGATGARGPKGASGDQGEKGEQGLQGVPGPAGSDTDIKNLELKIDKLEMANSYVRHLLGEEEDDSPENRLGGGIANWRRAE